MAYLCLHQQDRVGVIVFADEIKSLVKRSNARGQWRRIVNSLAGEPVQERTDIVKVAEQVMSKISKPAEYTEYKEEQTKKLSNIDGAMRSTVSALKAN